jgi:Terpene cyclase DEP1
MTQRVLLALTIVGFIVPNVLLGIYVADEGLDVGGYFSLWTDSTPSTQITLDLVIAAVAFLVWTTWDGPRTGIRRWWLVFPATLLVGLCFGLPLYLLMRERALEDAAAPAR